MAYFGATQPLPRSTITATPYSVVYQRTGMSGSGPSKFKTQQNFSEGRIRQNRRASKPQGFVKVQPTPC